MKKFIFLIIVIAALGSGYYFFKEDFLARGENREKYLLRGRSVCSGKYGHAQLHAHGRAHSHAYR